MRVGLLLSAVLAPAVLAVGCSGTQSVEPTGRIIVFGYPDVSLVPATGGTSQHLRIPAFSDVAYSPDEREVAFNADPNGIELLTPKDGRTTVIPNQPPQDDFLSVDLAWSPDGQSLAFVNGDTISTISTDGRNLREVTQGSLPSWTKDGAHIVFVAGWNGNQPLGDVSVVGLDGSGRRVLGRGLYPAVSPSGDEVAYSTLTGVFVQALAGGDERLVVANGFGPVWSPDGKFLAFTRYTSCGHAVCSGRVFVVPVAGGQPRPFGPILGDPSGPEDWIH